MMRAEPPFSHGSPSKTGLIWCNLGTPSSTKTSDVRRYLSEFLSDQRVVEIPKIIWWFILHLIILTFRPRKSAAKYASIWTAEGSPLLIWTQKQAELLQARLIQQYGPERAPLVKFAMRYGDHSIGQALSELQTQGVDKVLLLPAYPQYSATTTASVFDAAFDWFKNCRNTPSLRTVKHYHDHPSYIQALAQKIKQHWQSNGQAEMLVMSFHGVPERTLTLGDPYHCECYKTARLLREALGLEKDKVLVTFQSRLGRAKWLEPYTEPSLIDVAKKGVKKVDIVCPGFTSDCLETLEEIAMEVQHAFLSHGGEQFNYISCLNDDAKWIDAMTEIAAEHLVGWTEVPLQPDRLAESRKLAIDMGAKD